MQKIKFIFVFLIAFHFGSSQNEPPTIVAIGNQNYCGEAPMPIATYVEISDPDDNILNKAFVQISEGYSVGPDRLILNGTHPNISSSWSVAEGKLILTGPATLNEFEQAILDVVFQTTEAIFFEDKYFSINLGDANYLPSTGHYYVYVSSPGITWTTAKLLAEQQEYFGLTGYLATLTSLEEAEFAGEQSSGVGWIGASDAQVEGEWKWVTGPEEGTIFWLGQVDGVPQDGQYSFWNEGEPNNCCGGEDFAHITDSSVGLPGSWNDLPNTGSEDSSSPYHPKGYLVEFGGLAGEPEIFISASTKIVTPKVEIEEPFFCEPGIVDIELQSNANNILWFEASTALTPIHSGFTYNIDLSETTTFWVLPLFDGCVGGNKIPVTVALIGNPVADNISIVQCDDELQDGLTVFNINNYFENITGGEISDREINYFEDIGLTNEINGNAYVNTSTPQKIYALVTNTLYGCNSVSEIILEVSSNSSNNAFLEVCDDFVEDGFAMFNLFLANSQLFEGSPIGSSIKYYETYSDALLETNVLANNYINTTPYDQIVFARIENNGFCYNISEVFLKVNELPNIVTTETIYYCLNTYPKTIILDGGVIGDLPNNYYYDWSTGENTTSIEVNEIGTYTVWVTEPDGCTNQRTINVLPSSLAVINDIEIVDLSENNSITVLVSGAGNYEFALNNQNGIYQSSNIFTNVEAGIHTVYIKDENCGIVSKEISVIGYPKFFTPNNDGYNDTWQIKGISNQFQPNTQVQIFNRYGKLIHILNQSEASWDGKFNGSQLPVDDYWFVVYLDDGRVFRGHFTLKI